MKPHTPVAFFQSMCSIKTVSVKCTICLSLQYTVPRHSLDVTMENVSQTHTNVLVLIHVQMAVMKRDVVSTLCSHPIHIVMMMHRAEPLILCELYILVRDFNHP